MEKFYNIVSLLKYKEICEIEDILNSIIKDGIAEFNFLNECIFFYYNDDIYEIYLYVNDNLDFFEEVYKEKDILIYDKYNYITDKEVKKVINKVINKLKEEVTKYLKSKNKTNINNYIPFQKEEKEYKLLEFDINLNFKINKTKEV